MKKHFLFAAAVAALMTCACSVEPVDVVDVQPEEEGEITVLTAGFAGAEDETRTVRQADGKVFWSPGDAISIIRGTASSNRKKFTTNLSEPSPNAEFTGTMPTGTAAYWAAYPYNSGNNIQNVSGYNVFVTSLPAEQEAVAGSFADNLFISAAYVKNSSTSITFRHVCGGVKFSVTQAGINRVTLIPADDQAFLAGLIGLYAEAVDAVPFILATGNAENMSNTIVLSAPEGKTLEVGEAYHFVTLPATLAGGFTLMFEKEDGSFGFRTVSKDVAIQPAHFATLLEADKGVEFRKDFLEYSPEEISLDGLGGLFSIHVKGTLEYHFDTSMTDWIREDSATGDARIDRVHAFVAEPNDEGSERTGMFTICFGDNCYPIMVTQSAKGNLKAYPHHTLGMRFTATWCQYCPLMDATFHKAKDTMGDAFEYVCIYATSGNYGFDGSNTLTNYYKIDSYPSGILDGRFRLPNYNSSDYGAQVIAEVGAETVKYYPTATALGISSTLSGRNLTVKVDVRAQYEEDYKLTVLLCENGIIGNQSNYENPTTITDFNHSRVTRMSLTSFTGDLFEGPDAGAVKSLNYSATIPSGYNLANMEIVAFVQRSYGDRPAIQSASYGEWYVDNCRSAALGATAPLEVQ